jgi:hypothetical protein
MPFMRGRTLWVDDVDKLSGRGRNPNNLDVATKRSIHEILRPGLFDSVEEWVAHYASPTEKRSICRLSALMHETGRNVSFRFESPRVTDEVHLALDRAQCDPAAFLQNAQKGGPRRPFNSIDEVELEFAPRRQSAAASALLTVEAAKTLGVWLRSPLGTHDERAMIARTLESLHRFCCVPPPSPRKPRVTEAERFAAPPPAREMSPVANKIARAKMHASGGLPSSIAASPRSRRVQRVRIDEETPLDELPVMPPKRVYLENRADADVERERLAKKGQSSTLYFPWGSTFQSTYTNDYQEGESYRRVGLVPGLGPPLPA